MEYELTYPAKRKRTDSGDSVENVIGNLKSHKLGTHVPDQTEHFKMQNTMHDIRANSEELKDYISGLKSWEKEIKTEEKLLKERTALQTKVISLKEKGNKLYSDGKLEEATEVYSEGLNFDPNNDVLLANRAMAYMKLSEFQKAHSDCCKCIEINPKYIKVLLRRGKCRVQLGMLEEAIVDFESVLKLESWNKEALNEIQSIKARLSSKKECNVMKVSKMPAEISKMSEQTNGTCNHSTERTNCHNFKKFHEKSQKVEVTYPSELAGHKSSSHRTSGIVFRAPLKRIPVKDIDTFDDIESFQSVISKEDSVIGLSDVVEGQSLTEESSSGGHTVGGAMIPKTSHQFEHVWKRFKNSPDLAVEFLTTVPPSLLSKFEINSELLVSLVSVLCYDSVSVAQASEYFLAMFKSTSFAISVLFLDSSEKNELKNLINKIQDTLDKTMLSKLENYCC